MMVLEKFDKWVQEGPFTPVDLGIYRVLYSFSALLILPGIQWLSEYPDSMFTAPPGPFLLLSGFPSLTMLVALELLRSLALVLLGLGVWTKWVSIAVAVLELITYGLHFSLGKVGHTILMVLTPLILAFARWGDRISLDALRRKREPAPTPQWPLRFLALAIGLAFFEAAAIKFGTGWLSFSGQAVRGHFFENFIFLKDEQMTGLADAAANFQVLPVWEVLDWLTVIIEFAIIAAVPWWRAFRIALSVLTVFHLGVFLLMDIIFTQNLIVYAAFVSWGACVSRAPSISPLNDRLCASRQRAVGRTTVAILVLAALGVGAGAWYLTTSTAVLTEMVDVLFVLGGAVIGIVYLVRQFALCLRRVTSANRT